MMLFQNTSYCGTSYCDDLAWEDTSRWFREIEILLPNDSMRWKSLIRWFSGVEIFLSDDSVREHHPVATVGRKTHPLEPRHARHQFLLQHCHLCLSGCVHLQNCLHIKWYHMPLIQFAIECLSSSIKWKNKIQFFFSFIFVRTSNSVEPFGSTSCAWQARPAKMPEEPGVQVFWCPFISLNWVGGSYDWIWISQWTLTTNDVAKFLI